MLGNENQKNSKHNNYHHDLMIKNEQEFNMPLISQ